MTHKISLMATDLDGQVVRCWSHKSPNLIPVHAVKWIGTWAHDRRLAGSNPRWVPNPKIAPTGPAPGASSN